MFDNGMRLVHPGEILRTEYLEALGMSPVLLADVLKVSHSRVRAIVREQRGIKPGMALRLARYFGTTPEFWMSLQMTYGLRKAIAAAGDTIASTIQPYDPSPK